MNDMSDLVKECDGATRQNSPIWTITDEEVEQEAAGGSFLRPQNSGNRQVYMQRGRVFKPADPASLNLKETLPPGTYTIGVTQEGFHLEQVEDFSPPPRLYGDVDSKARRILDTFIDRPSGTGVLLSGNKGSGKTMLAKRISQLALDERGIITILISQPICGEAFNTFLQDIQQPAIVIFDEFEKVYDNEKQPKLLTIFDGTYPSKKLFVLTCNDRWRVDSHMHNRPGRIYYAIEFGGLNAEFIKEYCEINLKNRQHLPGIVNVGALFNEFSFDMLKALVEEMNRYKETATQAMRMLNIKPQADSGINYTIKVMREGKELLADRTYPTTLSRSPLALFEDFHIRLYVQDDEDEDSGRKRSRRAKREHRPGYILKNEEFSVTIGDLLRFDSATRVFTFKTHMVDTFVVFQREVKSIAPSVNYDAF